MSDGPPVGWTTARIGDMVFALQYGYTAKAENGGSGPKFLRITDLENGQINWSTVPNCHVSQGDLAKYRLREGDLVFARTGSIEKACRVKNPPEAVFASYLIRGSPVDRAVGPWLATFVSSHQYVNQATAASAGIGRANINAKNLARIELPVPPLPEQHRIVEAIGSYFTRLDDSVATLERVQRNLKRYRASVLKAAVEGRLVPTEADLASAERRDYEPAWVLLERLLTERRRRWETSGRKGKYRKPFAPEMSNLAELPKGWCWATIEQLASPDPRSIQSGPFGSNLRHSEFQSTGKLVIGIDNVQDGFFSMGANHRISEEKFAELEKYRARPGDLLVTVMATIGRCCIVPDDIEPAIITKHVYRVTAERRALVPHYLRLAVWGGPAVRAQMFGQVQGQTRPGLNGTIIKRLAIPVPPLREQHRIVAEADRLLSIAYQATASLVATTSRCNRLRQSILRWAFVGKLTDQDPNDEPASMLLERIKAQRAAATPTMKTRPADGRAKKTA